MSKVIQLANSASNILRIDSELGGFELIKENIIKEWANSPSVDKKGREACYRQLKTLSELQRYLRKLVDDGKIEESNNG